MEVKVLKPKSVLGKAKYKTLGIEIIQGIEIPKGFITDGATVPRLLWPILPPISSYLEATVVHDYLIDTGVNRYEADKIFRLACIEYDVTTTITNVMFICIVAYGFCKQPSHYLKK